MPTVAADERLLVKALQYAGIFRVIARYGYTDRVDQVSPHKAKSGPRAVLWEAGLNEGGRPGARRRRRGQVQGLRQHACDC